MKLAEGTFAGLHPLEVDLFRQHLKGTKGLGVEIGCCDGYSSAVILDASGLHLTSIDPFIPDSMEPSLVGSKERYLENVKPFDKEGSVDRMTGRRSGLINGYAHDHAGHALSWTDERLSFLFIDGDHTYPAVLQDFEDWTPLLATGGILAMHDARMGRPGGAKYHPGPSQVAKERIFSKPEEWEVIGEAHSLVLARKR